MPTKNADSKVPEETVMPPVPNLEVQQFDITAKIVVKSASGKAAGLKELKFTVMQAEFNVNLDTLASSLVTQLQTQAPEQI